MQKPCDLSTTRCLKQLADMREAMTQARTKLEGVQEQAKAIAEGQRALRLALTTKLESSKTKLTLINGGKV